MAQPFVLPFEHKGRYYIYDVNTNNVLKVDKTLFALIKHVDIDHNTSPAVACLDHHSSDLLPELDVSSCLRNITRAYTEQGLFSDHRPRAVIFPFSSNEIRALLENGIHSILLSITHECNNRCAYCAYSGTYAYARTHDNEVMSTDIAVKAIDFLVEHSSWVIDRSDHALSVGFYGGEPLLNFGVLQRCLSHIATQYSSLQNRFEYLLTSNLTIRNNAILTFLTEHNIDLSVSLDGPKRLHDRYRVSRHGGGTFEHVMQNLEFLKRSYPEYYDSHVRFTAVMAPPYDMQAIYEFFIKSDLLHGHPVTVTYVAAADTTFFDRFPNRQEIRAAHGTQVRCLFDQFLARVATWKGEDLPWELELLNALLGRRTQSVFRRDARRLGSAIYPNGICIPGFAKTFVDTRGELYPCERVEQNMPIGTLDAGYDVTAILSAIERFRANSEHSCLDCWAVRFCGKCYTSILRGRQFDEHRKAAECEAFRMATLSELKMYCDAIEGGSGGTAERFFKGLRVSSAMELAFRLLPPWGGPLLAENSLETGSGVRPS